MHRNFILTTAFSTIFFICFLGMRNPSLHDNHRPKPHPRAIIEESTKAPQEISKSHSLDVEVGQAATILPELPCFRFFSRQLLESPPVKARQLVARAPPVVFSRQT